MLRWVVLLVLMFGWGAALYQRAVVSPLISLIMGDLNTSPAQVGYVFSAFALGLGLGAIVLAVLTVFLGTRSGLLIALGGASLMAVLSGASFTLWMLIVSRFLAGFLTGGLLAVIVQAIREWFPWKERALAIGLVLATGQFTLAVAVPSVGLIAGPLGWRPVLIASALPALIAAALCLAVWLKPPPVEVSTPNATAAMASGIALAAGLLFAAPVVYFVFSWMPVYLSQQWAGRAGQTIPWASAGVYLLAAAGAVFAGILNWALVSWTGWPPSQIRAVLLTAFGAVLPFIALGAIARDSAIAILLCAAVAGAYQGWVTLLYSAVADTFPAGKAVLGAAIGLLAGTGGNFVTSSFADTIIRSSGYNALFLLIGACAAIAAAAVAAIAWLIPQEPVAYEGYAAR